MGGVELTITRACCAELREIIALQVGFYDAVVLDISDEKVVSNRRETRGLVERCVGTGQLDRAGFTSTVIVRVDLVGVAIGDVNFCCCGSDKVRSLVNVSALVIRRSVLVQSALVT